MEPSETRPSLVSRLPAWALAMLLAVAAMWTIEIVDSAVLDDTLQGGGIQPRRISGLDGILFAPFLHSTFGHLASNSIPFLVLGSLVAIRGFRRWVLVTATGVAVGGALTWLLAGSGNHIGASGVVFAYFGALVGAAIIERRAAAIAPALVAVLLYSGILVGLVPQTSISWEGHLFGLVAGMLSAHWLAQRPAPRPDVPQPWEADQPWLQD